MRRLAVVALAAVLMLGALAFASYWGARMPAAPTLSPEARVALFSLVRGGQGANPTPAELNMAVSGPMIVGVWELGSETARVVVSGDNLGEMARAANGALLSHSRYQKLSADRKKQARFKIDVVYATRSFATGSTVFRTYALHPGIDGLGAVVGEQANYLLADDLIRMGLLSSGAPIKGVDFRTGLSFESARNHLRAKAGLEEGPYEQAEPRYMRFRTLSYVEAPGGPVRVHRGVSDVPRAATADELREAAVLAGRYLVGKLADNGRYVYEYNLTGGRGTDPHADGPYALPRHAGTTYFLAELYRHSREEFLVEPVERAISHLAELIELSGCSGTAQGGEPYSCVAGKGHSHAGLGSTALSVVALAEYQRATGSEKFAPLAERLTRFVLHMQRPDGTFAHRIEVASQVIDQETEKLYYTGEACLALARMHELTRRDEYIEAAERGLDSILEGYDFFLGGFLFGEEHWTCIAAEAAWPALKHQRYNEFCTEYGQFLRRLQVRPGDFPGLDDLAGSYMISPFVMPQNTPAGSLSETMISAFQLSAHHGQPDAEIRDQILRTARYLLKQQVRDDAMWDRAPGGLGAMPTTPVDRSVRIDYVQHTASALLRAAELVD